MSNSSVDSTIRSAKDRETGRRGGEAGAEGTGGHDMT